MRRLVLFVVILATLCVAIVPGSAGAAMHSVVHLPKGTEAEALAVGPEGELWFAGVHRGAGAANVSGRIAGDGTVEEFPVPGSGSTLGVGDLTLGPDGNMWFTEPNAGRIDFESPKGGRPGILVLPDPHSRPTGLATVGDAIWTTLEGTGQFLATYPATSFGEAFEVPGSSPSAVAFGGDEALWAIDAGGTEILRKAPAGRSISFPTPAFAKGAKFTDIVDGPEGDLWLSQSDGPYISRLQPEINRYTRFVLPLESDYSLISNGPRHDLWFAGEGMIGSITNDGHFPGTPTCALPGCPAVTALAEGPEGDLWFASGEKIARFQPEPLAARPWGRVFAKGRSKATTMLECGGGAAGQHCQGKLEMRPAKGAGRALGSVRFDLVTGTSRKVTLNLTGAAAAELARDGKLSVRLAAWTGGKLSPAHTAVLKAAK